MTWARAPAVICAALERGLIEFAPPRGSGSKADPLLFSTPSSSSAAGGGIVAGGTWAFKAPVAPSEFLPPRLVWGDFKLICDGAVRREGNSNNLLKADWWGSTWELIAPKKVTISLQDLIPGQRPFWMCYCGCSHWLVVDIVHVFNMAYTNVDYTGNQYPSSCLKLTLWCMYVLIYLFLALSEGMQAQTMETEYREKKRHPFDTWGTRRWHWKLHVWNTIRELRSAKDNWVISHRWEAFFLCYILGVGMS